MSGKKWLVWLEIPVDPLSLSPGQSTGFTSGQPSFLTSSPLLLSPLSLLPSFSLSPSFFGNLGPWEVLLIFGGALLWKATCPWLTGKMGHMPYVCMHTAPQHRC